MGIREAGALAGASDSRRAGDDTGDTSGPVNCPHCLAIARRRLGTDDIVFYKHPPGPCPLDDDGSLRATDDDSNRGAPRADNDPDGGICQW